MPLKAYISHARQDEPVAQRLAQVLRKRGLAVFQADTAIAPGESWAARRQEEIAGSAAMAEVAEMLKGVAEGATSW